MKILHTLAQLPMKTGSGVYFSTLVDGMEKLGHENAVIYGVQEPYKIDYEDRLKAYPVYFDGGDLSFPIAGMSDVMPYRSTIYSKMTDEEYGKWIKVFRQRLEEAKRDFKPDVVITHHLFVLSSLVREIFSDTPVVAISHGTDIRQIKKHPWIKEKYIKDIEKINQFFAIGPYDVKEIKNLFSIEESKIKIMGGGFNPEIFYPNPKKELKETIEIYYAGKISHAKGIYELVQTLPIIEKKHPNVVMNIVGCASEEEITKLKKLSGQSQRLKIYNKPTQKAMADDMRDKDIFILPSYYEGLGLTVIEALASGLFTVATEIEGLMGLLGDDFNNCGLIEYVPFPKLYDVDKIAPEEIPSFVENLSRAIIRQIDRFSGNPLAVVEAKDRIGVHSWENILSRIDSNLKDLVSNYKSI